jgi:hypothetical protein
VFNAFRGIAKTTSFIVMPISHAEVIFGQDNIFMYQPHEYFDFHGDFGFHSFFIRIICFPTEEMFIH